MSTAAAITEGLKLQYGDNVTVKTIDVLKEYAPQPLDLFPEAYRLMIKSPQFWKRFYEIGDGQRRKEIVTRSISMYARRHAKILFEHNPADVVVSTYHLANRPMIDAIDRNKLGVPFVTVVTDLVTTPPVWFDKRTDLCVVPTPEASYAALASGLKPDQIQIIGLPISRLYSVSPEPKTAIRAELGYDRNLPLIIVMAGGEGIGPLGQITDALSNLPATIITITGRNTRLYKKLTAEVWPDNVHILGFVDNIARLTQAASILVTKAGPTSIVEAFNCHVPIILYSRLPGQEEGNVDFVLSRGAGLWAPTPRLIRQTAEAWITDPKRLKHFSRGAASAAQPDASLKIATAIGHTVGLE